jgi:hypothetical protein
MNKNTLFKALVCSPVLALRGPLALLPKTKARVGLALRVHV